MADKKIDEMIENLEYDIANLITDLEVLNDWLKNSLTELRRVRNGQ